MYPNNLLRKSLNLESIIDRQPLVVPPEMPLTEVILMMSQSQGRQCLISDPSATSSVAAHSSVLVLENNQLVGIFTERDLVKLTATQTNLRGMNIAAVMTRQIHTLVWSAEQTVISALNILNHHHIRHLPVLDAQGQLLGIITPDHIRRVLQPTDLLKFRSVQEGMTTNVIHAPTNTTILQIAQLMVAHGISSIVIVDGGQPLRPVGIVTEKDVVQFQVLELDLAQLTAGAVMSSPLFCLQSADSLWSAQQVMASRRIRRLLVTGAQGELQGIVTQSNLLQSFDPLEMIKVVDSLQAQLLERATELEQANQELRLEVSRRQQVEADLHQVKQSLEERVVAKTAELELLNGELQAKITEQQSCDIALEISQQGISDFMENALMGMHWFDFRVNKLGQKEGIIVWANQAELDMLGYDRQEYLGRPLIDFHVDQETIRDIFQRLLNNESVAGREAQMRRKDGSICHVSINANAFIKDGKFIHARCFTRDISDQKLLEQQFLRVQRLESLGTLATGIAHDLNNVLTPIVGIAQLLPNTLPNLDERNQRLLNMLVESSRRGSKLVKQILTFARGMDGQRIVLQVRHILAEIISVARQTFPRSIEIILDLDPVDLWLVSVDATQIHQVLMNLFVNARDAMPNGGAITATAKNVVLNNTATTVPINPRTGSYVVITVTDTGVGIDREVIDKIFNPFFTTKETGTGLGLSTVLGIIKAHYGFIDVHSEVGQGTCFTMYLPALKSNEEEHPQYS
jgi:PAS domain S-box-containing protein